MSDSSSPASFIAPDPAELSPLFPGYDIEGLTAAGGMGAVYQAVQKSLDRSVAIKILPPELSSDAAFRAGFEAEAKAMARLNHPNLIGVYDFGEVAGMLYIIMEFVHGKSLFHSSHGIAIDPAEVVRIVSGICSGLAHAHDNGIIHRDIKPANILLDPNANPKIGDFGLARPADRQIQEGEEIFGTPHYTAPEVVSSPHSVDHRADIFSLGVILHELLTGCLPAEDPRTASAISHCDPRFDAIIRRATAPLPENRYSSAHEIERELHTIATSAGPRVLKTAVRAAPHGIRRPPVKQSSGNPGLVFLFIAALVGVGVYLIVSGKKQPPKEMVPETTIPAAPQTQDPEEPSAETTHEPAPPPQGEPAAPDPTPAEHPEPEENQISESTPDSGKEPDAVLPKFDVPAFLEHARKTMYERAAPQKATRDEDLKENLARFEQVARRSVRRIDADKERVRAGEKLDLLVEDSEENRNRIQAKLDRRLERFQEIEEIYDACREKQAAIDLLFIESLAKISSTYTLGLEKQIERLQGENDPAAIKALQEEIAKTRDDKTYFPDLMLDIESGNRETE